MTRSQQNRIRYRDLTDAELELRRHETKKIGFWSNYVEGTGLKEHILAEVRQEFEDISREIMRRRAERN